MTAQSLDLDESRYCTPDESMFIRIFVDCWFLTRQLSGSYLEGIISTSKGSRYVWVGPSRLSGPCIKTRAQASKYCLKIIGPALPRQTLQAMGVFSK